MNKLQEYKSKMNFDVWADVATPDISRVVASINKQPKKLLWHASPYIGGGLGTKCFDNPEDAIKYLEVKCEQDSTSYKLKEKIQEWYWIEKIWVSSDGNACVFEKRDMYAFNEYLIELGGANWFARTEASF